MQRLHPHLLNCLVLISIAAPMIEADEPSQKGLPSPLTGRWVLVSTEIDGEVYRYDPRSAVFEDNEYRWYCNDKLSKRAIVTVDARQEPRFLDLQHQIGPSKGMVHRCIYNLKDADTLMIAYGVMEGARPTRFDSRDPRFSTLTTWRRMSESQE